MEYINGRFGHVAQQLENNDGGAVVLMGQPFNHSPASGLISRTAIKKFDLIKGQLQIKEMDECS